MKELFLVIRAGLTAVHMFVLYVFAGILPVTVILLLGGSVFMSSFIWQYLFLHYALKGIAREKRPVFLLVWMLVCTGILTVALVALPGLEGVTTYPKEELVTRTWFWAGVFIVLSSAHIASSCARRAFQMHGAL